MLKKNKKTTLQKNRKKRNLLKKTSTELRNRIPASVAFRCRSAADAKVRLSQTSAFAIHTSCVCGGCGREREREKKKLRWKRQKHQAGPTLDGRPSVLSSWLEREREKRAARVVGRRLKQKRQNDGLVALLWCSYEEDVEIYALTKTPIDNICSHQE